MRPQLPARTRRAAMSSILVVAAALAAAPWPSVACSGSKLIFEANEEIYERRVEFTGTVVRRDDPNPGPVISTGDWIRWTFAVDSITRGQLGDRITVTSARTAGSCGTEFVLGRRYSVVAWGGDDPATPDVGPGDARELEPLANPPRVEGSFTDLPIVGVIAVPLANPVVGVLLLAVLVVAWWLLRMRRPGHARA